MPVNLSGNIVQAAELTVIIRLGYRSTEISHDAKILVQPFDRMKTEKISDLTIGRLSVYLRCLNHLAASGVRTVSSKGLAERFNLKPAQIRKDLAYFGEFGVRGVGYYVEDLRRQLMKILGLNERHRIAIIGLGNLGMALANYRGFDRTAFEVVALLDDDPQKVGVELPGGLVIHPVSNINRIIKSLGVNIVIIAVPASAAENVMQEVMDAGVRAVLNFAPVRLMKRPGVNIKNVDLTTSLESLSYFLANPGHDGGQLEYVDLLEFESEPDEISLDVQPG